MDVADVVRVINPKEESLYDQLVALYKIFRGKSINCIIKFDLSDVNWLFPLLILPIASYIRDTSSTYIPPSNLDVYSYLETIKFPNGVNSVSHVSQMQSARTYIPIYVLERNDPQREKLTTSFAEMVYKVLNPTTQVKDAVYYPILELVANIFDHSKVNEGYVFAQYYPNKGFVDLCIVDRGRGIAGSYKEEKNLDLSDIEAINYALKGISTKPESARGFGIRTSQRIICDGLGGEFVLISGNAAFYSSQSRKFGISLPNFYWKGVIVAYRIPRPEKPINIYEYIE